MGDNSSNIKVDYRIPVTILSGFLGSGKTTLLNKLIKDHPEKKFAIIENEFGEIPIDNELVIGADDGIFEMSNGCVCCSLNDELINILIKLIKRPQKINHLIVETTGVADPAPVIMNFISDSNIKSLFRLDAVITLADAQFIEQQIENESVVRMQLTMADLILINKTDRVDSYLKETAFNIISRMNTEAQIKECTYGTVSDLDLLNIQAYDQDRKLVKSDKVTESKFDKIRSLKPLEDIGVSSSSSVLHHSRPAHQNISSHSFVFEEPLDILRFDIWLRLILNHNNMTLYRVKGILNFKALNEKLVLQAVYKQYVTESGGLWDEQERTSKLVFIGKNLDKDLLLNGLKVCCSEKPFVPAEFYKEINLE
jgi:G3E family GTPase